MGERFSAFRAAWGDTWTSPLRAASRRDQGRLGKLVYRGERITDRQDAQLARELLLWHLRVTRRWLTLTVVGLLLFGSSAGLMAVLGQRTTSLLLVAVLVGGDLCSVFLIIYARGRLKRTREANGWD